jgi:acid phosphatase
MQNARIVPAYAAGFLCATFTLSQLFNFEMRVPNVIASAWLPVVVAQNGTIDLSWHAPKKTWINDLNRVLNDTGTNGFQFNGSVLRDGVPYGTYNWCNMPHVRREEYPKASDEYTLQYVEV